jgi:hypothetical protein
MKNVKHDKLLSFNDWAEAVEEGKHDSELGRVCKIINNGDADSWIKILNSHVNSDTACHVHHGPQVEGP